MSVDVLFETPGWSINHGKRDHPDGLSASATASSSKRSQRKRKRTKCKETIPKEAAHTPGNDMGSALKTKKAGHAKKPSQEEAIAPKPDAQTSSSHLAINLLNSNLAGSRFRMLNEALYTCSGSEAAQLLNNPDDQAASTHQIFAVYHQGFRNQTKSWPQNPVNVIANQLQEEFKTKSKTVLVADLGCGEAPLAKLLCKKSNPQELPGAVQNKKPFHLEFKVFSFDLVADSEGWVNTAECSSLVITGAFARLSFGHLTKWNDGCCSMLLEPNGYRLGWNGFRSSKSSGQLKIAEVASRFVNIDKFIQFIESIGFSRCNKDKLNTHFIIFTFKKIPKTDDVIKSQTDFDKKKIELIKQGKHFLKPCIYKRR
uniref:Ribosomal RNA-processing protein 8 n=1 Tax=Puccinia cf. psidii AE-2014 TaxID=1505670 RepID=A0A060IP19_9BASI|nr:S-adenosylmethionine-dependent methyltransferase [Puccinia cf. psidii AE-2014]